MSRKSSAKSKLAKVQHSRMIRQKMKWIMPRWYEISRQPSKKIDQFLRSYCGKKPINGERRSKKSDSRRNGRRRGRRKQRSGRMRSRDLSDRLGMKRPIWRIASRGRSQSCLRTMASSRDLMLLLSVKKSPSSLASRTGHPAQRAYASRRALSRTSRDMRLAILTGMDYCHQKIAREWQAATRIDQKLQHQSQKDC